MIKTELKPFDEKIATAVADKAKFVKEYQANCKHPDTELFKALADKIIFATVQPEAIVCRLCGKTENAPYGAFANRTVKYYVSQDDLREMAE